MLSLNISICTCNSFNSLAIHPLVFGICHTPSHLLKHSQVSSLRPPSGLATPVRGTETQRTQAAFLFSCKLWLGDTVLVGCSGQHRAVGMQGSGDMGYLKSQGSSCCEQEGWNSPGTEPVPQSTWEPSGDLQQQRSAAPEVYLSRKTNNFGKASAFGRLSLCRTGVAEKLSLG